MRIRNPFSFGLFQTGSQLSRAVFTLSTLGAALSLIACFDSDINSPNPDNSKMPEDKPSVAVADSIDPYVASNMKKALVVLMKRNVGGGSSLGKSAAVAEAEEFEIKPNYLYVRFLPYGKAQKSELFKHDSNLVLFDRPMGEGLEEGSDTVGYHDPSLSDSVYPYFATVPVGYNFNPEIRVEVIKSLFLVQPIVSAVEGDAFEGTTGPLEKAAAGVNVQALLKFLEENGLTLQDLEAASLELTGQLNSKDYGVAPNGLAKRAFFDRWRPKGTLKYKDTHLVGDRPVVGVRVTAGYWYYWRSSRTDANGYFVSPERWTYSVKYKAHWDADDFLMEDHDSWYGADLVTEGPTLKSPWNRTFMDEHADYATIFTAAWDYYYGPIDGLNRPRKNGWFNMALDLQVTATPDREYTGLHVTAFLANWIIIRTRGYYEDVPSYHELSSPDLYSVTIHELAHSSHYVAFTPEIYYVRDADWSLFVSNTLQESFAAGIQWWLTKKKYPSYGRTYNGKYTGIIQDLIDDGSSFAPSKTSDLGDAVSGFTIRQVEVAVAKSYTMNELKSNLKSMFPPGNGRVYNAAGMDALFAYWISK